MELAGTIRTRFLRLASPCGRRMKLPVMLTPQKKLCLDTSLVDGVTVADSFPNWFPILQVSLTSRVTHIQPSGNSVNNNETGLTSGSAHDHARTIPPINIPLVNQMNETILSQNKNDQGHDLNDNTNRANTTSGSMGTLDEDEQLSPSLLKNPVTNVMTASATTNKSTSAAEIVQPRGRSRTRKLTADAGRRVQSTSAHSRTCETKVRQSTPRGSNLEFLGRVRKTPKQSHHSSRGPAEATLYDLINQMYVKIKNHLLVQTCRISRDSM